MGYMAGHLQQDHAERDVELTGFFRQPGISQTESAANVSQLCVQLNYENAASKLRVSSWQARAVHLWSSVMLSSLPHPYRSCSIKSDREEAGILQQYIYQRASSRTGSVGFTVRWTKGADVCELCFRDAIDSHIGLKLRSAEVEKRMRAKARGQERHRWDKATFRLILENASDSLSFAAFCEILSSELALVAFRPFTPRLLVAALSITNQERLRWTKDGRLPTSGSVTIRRGQLIHVPTYDVGMVEALLAEPSIVDAWRVDDRLEGLSTRQPTG